MAANIDPSETIIIALTALLTTSIAECIEKLYVSRLLVFRLQNS